MTSFLICIYNKKNINTSKRILFLVKKITIKTKTKKTEEKKRRERSKQLLPTIKERVKKKEKEM